MWYLCCYVCMCICMMRLSAGRLNCPCIHACQYISTQATNHLLSKSIFLLLLNSRRLCRHMNYRLMCM
jgi:hypothetical protein